MKTKIKQEKDFDTVKTFRAIKEKISKDIYGMNIDQLNTYLAEGSKKFYEQSRRAKA